MDKCAAEERNFYVEKHNLVLVCRLVIKSVIDRASVGGLDEDSPEVINLLTTIEHILNHRMKASLSLFDTNRPSFWVCLKDTGAKKNAAISKVLAMSSLKSNVARGRAWLRIALMEKNLADSLHSLMSQQQILSKHYEDGAIMTSDEMQILHADMIGLSAVDFSFCLRNRNNNLIERMLVDYSPYLKFEHCVEGIENDIQEVQESLASRLRGDDDDLESYQSAIPTDLSSADNLLTGGVERQDMKERLAALQRAFRTSSEQKGYLEEMLKKAESEMASWHAEYDKVLSEWEMTKETHSKEMKQLETVILELQNELHHVKTNNKEMQKVISQLYKRMNSNDHTDRNHRQRHDSSSLYSDNLSLDDMTLREDNSSLKPMYGSLASDSDNANGLSSLTST